MSQLSSKLYALLCEDRSFTHDFLEDECKKWEFFHSASKMILTEGKVTEGIYHSIYQEGFFSAKLFKFHAVWKNCQIDPLHCLKLILIAKA